MNMTWDAPKFWNVSRRPKIFKAEKTLCSIRRKRTCWGFYIVKETDGPGCAVVWVYQETQFDLRWSSWVSEWDCRCFSESVLDRGWMKIKLRRCPAFPRFADLFGTLQQYFIAKKWARTSVTVSGRLGSKVADLLFSSGNASPAIRLFPSDPVFTPHKRKSG